MEKSTTFGNTGGIMAEAAIPYILAGTAVVSTVSSIQQSKKASSAQQRAEALRQKQADRQNRLQKIKQLRQARIARGQAEAAQSGVSGGAQGSQALGVGSTIQSQLGSNLGFLNQSQGINNQISQANISGIKAQDRSNVFGAVASISGDIFETQGGYKELFKKNG